MARVHHPVKGFVLSALLDSVADDNDALHLMVLHPPGTSKVCNKVSQPSWVQTVGKKRLGPVTPIYMYTRKSLWVSTSSVALWPVLHWFRETDPGQSPQKWLSKA